MRAKELQMAMERAEDAMLAERMRANNNVS